MPSQTSFAKETTMKRIVTTSLTALALLLGGTAIAATTTPKPTMTTCESLIKQFDDSVGAHGGSPNLQKAKDMRMSGEKACKAGDYNKGVADLHLALKDIGVKAVR